MHQRTEEILWLLLSMVVVALAYAGARRFLARSDAAGALAVVAACQLLISPVSWSHHWVWIAPMTLPLAVRVFRSGTRLAKAGMAGLLVIFVVGPQWLFPNDHGLELHWGWWENVIGDTYAIVTLGFVVWSASHQPRIRAKALAKVSNQTAVAIQSNTRPGAVSQEASQAIATVSVATAVTPSE
jgi:alpha-1,2-mannosyltransferase